MDARERMTFVNAYTKILTTTWSSEEFAQRLTTDARGALAEFGLTVPSDVAVEVSTTIAGEPDLEAQIADWERGLERKRVVLHVPDMPQISTAELAEGELESVAGGNTYCCCCCPCCSST
jgi:hypothetical protein